MTVVTASDEPPTLGQVITTAVRLTAKATDADSLAPQVTQLQLGPLRACLSR